MSGQATQSEEWTVGRLLNWTRDYLRDKGLDQPQLCAQLLLAHALDCRRLDLYLRFGATPDPAQLEAFRDVVRRAARGEPIAYLTGRKEFFSLEFQVTPDVLIPRPETETLVETVIATARTVDRPIHSILELCTGSGCVATSLAAQLPDLHLTATDVSSAALAVARENIARHGLADRVTLRQGDLFAGLDDQAGRFAIIVANPPYIRTADLQALSAGPVGAEPQVALDGGEDGLDVIRRIVAGAPDHLAEAGWLFLEVGYDQADAVRALYQEVGLCDVRSTRDGLGHERAIAGRRA